MDIKQIEQLAEIMNANGLTSLTIKEKDVEICLEKPGLPPYLQDACSAGIIGRADGPASIVVDQPLSPQADTAASSEGNTVYSPTVGVFYASPSPESEPFVHVGSKVKKGDTLCVVEAMKLMNEITCDFEGTVAEVCVGNGQVVEYGQPLFCIV